MSSLQNAFLKHLKEIEFFMELQEANPFKIRAYRNAQEVLGNITAADFKKRLAERNLTSLKGIGKGIAQVAEDFQEQQTSEEWKAARGSFPTELLGFRELKGLGAKKIRLLHERLGLKSVGELEYACLENRLLDLPGFGKKTQEKVLAEIQIWKKKQTTQLISQALEEASEIEKNFSKDRLWARVGELGTKREIVHRLDYLFVSKKTPPRFSFLKTLSPGTSQGDSPFRVIDFESKSNRKLRIYFCEEKEFPIASVFLNSSPEHWAFLQKKAVSKKLELTEKSLIKNGKTIRPNSDRDVYQSLGLTYSPPEAREYAQEAVELVEESDLHGAFHAHSHYSDGRNSLQEMAKACEKAGWSYLGMSEHSQSAFYARGLDGTRLQEQWNEINAWNKKSSLKILKGIESDILKDGALDYQDATLKKFDFIIASIHQRYGLKDMTDRLVKAIQKSYTDIIGHISGRLLLAREPYHFDKELVFREAIQKKVVIELNCNPHRLDLDWRDCREACQQGLLISISPDAHSVEGFDDVQYGLSMARKALVPKDQIINTWPLKKLEAFFRERRA